MRVIAVPGSRLNEVVERRGDAWKIRIAAVPEKGRANRSLEAFLAEILDVKRATVRVISGHTIREKVVEIDGLTEEEGGRRLEAAARRQSITPS